MEVVLGAVILALVSGGAGLGAGRFPRLLGGAAHAALAASGACATWAGVAAMLAPGRAALAVLPIGLPWLAWHLRMDALSGVFVFIIGAVSLAVSLYAPSYVREYRHGPNPIAVLHLFTGLFIAAMLLVCIANDAFAFMVAWEMMSLSSYFLVVFEHQHAANRRAAFLYLVMAEVSGLIILLGFGVLAAFGHGLTFAAMARAPLAPLWAGVAFTCALVGFGTKAGLVPFHAWLPEAHPVAPSHVSALMSGVMLKVAVYGFIRFVFGLLGVPSWRWGIAALVLGCASALLGVLFALMQHDLKRLLAYHSVENLGIVFIGLGLALLFGAAGFPAIGALALTAALFHSLNHALFKSLLFLGAGAIAHTSHERDLEHMGGLVQRMPWTAAFFLVGCVSISALPPSNGFASEWLTFQAFLQTGVLASGSLRAVLPLAAAVLALAAALAAACFVKVYGIAFLGRARTRHVRRAREVSRGMRAAQGGLAVLCIGFGVGAGATAGVLAPIAGRLLGTPPGAAMGRNWLWLTPIARDVASYSAPLVFAGIALTALIIFALRGVHRRRYPLRRAPAWDCGFGGLDPSMQYTAGSFSMPIRRIFAPAWRVQERVLEERDALGFALTVEHRVLIEDRAWAMIYEPIVRAVHWSARRVARLQSGQVRTYLLHSFFTLLILLWVVS